MKRALSLILTAVLLSSTAAQTYAAQFADAVATPFEIAVKTLSDAGVIHGYSDGSVRPYGALTRAEAIKTIILARPELASQVSWYQQNPSPLPLFADIDSRSWYAPYVEVAFKHGIITGYPDGTLRPNAILYPAEGIALIIRAFVGGSPADGFKQSLYIQNADRQWFTPFISAAISKNIIMHAQMSLFDPLTRGRFFDMAYRMREVYIKKLPSFSGPEPQMPAQINPPTVDSIIPGSSGAPESDVDALTYASKQNFAITIPSLGISDLTVTHPADPFTAEGVLVPLKQGVGHLFSYPGQQGKIMIYGHSSGYAWDTSKYTKIFRQINKAKVGGKIYLTYNGKLYVYKVTQKKTIAAKDTKPFQPDGKEELILYTCWPPDSIAQRYLVIATPVQTLTIPK